MEMEMEMEVEMGMGALHAGAFSSWNINACRCLCNVQICYYQAMKPPNDIKISELITRSL